jgi:hypothetical protein
VYPVDGIGKAICCEQRGVRVLLSAVLNLLFETAAVQPKRLSRTLPAIRSRKPALTLVAPGS